MGWICDNHTGLAAERIVIHLAVAAGGGIVAQIVDHNLHKGPCRGPVSGSSSR